MKSDPIEGLSRRQLLGGFAALAAMLSAAVPASADFPAFPNIDAGLRKVRRTGLRSNLSGMVSRMEAARVAGDGDALAAEFRRLSWAVVALEHSLAPGPRRSLLRGLLRDAAAHQASLPNRALARREVRRMATLA